jgi:hypothetical protein
VSASDHHEGGGADVKDVPALGELDRCLEWEFPAGAVRVDAADAGDGGCRAVRACHDQRVDVLTQLRGIGPYTAMLLIAEVVEIERLLSAPATSAPGPA